MPARDPVIHGIIHSAAASAAGVGAGLAQLPGSDAPVLVSIQTAMIIAIAAEHGESVSKAAAAQLMAGFAAPMGGRFVSQALVGWIPGAGNFINASTAAAITEGIGWAAHFYFGDDG